MSSSKFSFHRLADGELIRKSKIELGKYHFEYTNENNERMPITQSGKSDINAIELPGTHCDWTSSDNIIVMGSCIVGKTSPLFNKKSGIAFEDGVLGIAAVISSALSSRRVVVPFEGEIGISDSDAELTLEYIIPKDTIRSHFSIKTIIYLKKSGSGNVPDIYDNRSGAVFGSIGMPVHVYLENQSPEFPTREINGGSGSPLWTVSVSWKDPRIEAFLESVCIYINRDHPEYGSLKLNHENKNKALLNEIYSGALLQIILRLKSEGPNIWDDTINLNPNTVQGGSVSDYIGYMMKEIFKSGNDDVMRLSEKIRKTIYGGL